jgi:signal transduction histidine kinase
MSLADAFVVDFASADTFHSGMRRVVARLWRSGGADQVEWWAPSGDGASLRIEVSHGAGCGRRDALPLGPAGAIVLTGEGAPQVTAAVMRLLPVLRRRWTEERLAEHAAVLARRVEALEDFAALVAHELKSPLHDALVLDDPHDAVQRALELVHSLLEVARSGGASDGSAPTAECLDDALRDLGPIASGVVANLSCELPMPREAQRLLLRNLLANAVAAGAKQIHVSGMASEECWTLVVDDDGVGLEDAEHYVAGSGLGLSLCTRLAARFGGTLELKPRARGGTRATLMLSRRCRS